ncbi:unnamed protein product [Microthlaspi erraticum]|uniref:At1g61320/AtMIF1 LRR domain-containing protein n=1 Tax=Microthlaspi erraticum TaxID=1685480 RepID=A0A6D2KDB8_9BRAS|nr:unnamed protein product [Microthlaspi erraticum]
MSQKRMSLTRTLPDDIVEHIMSSFLPIKNALKSRLVSKRFRHAPVQSRNLDFSSVRGTQFKVVRIIEEVFEQHKGVEINRLALNLNHKGVEDKILAWIQTCLNKNIQELELDFSKSKKSLEIPVDFSAVQTLTVLKLRWCKFDIPNNSPTGLKLLRTLALMKTKVKKEMLDAIFVNCIHLEILELVSCQLYGILSINAQGNQKFKTLVMYSNPKIRKFLLNAPTLECFKYDGAVRMVDFSGVNAVKEVNLLYRHTYQRKFDNMYDIAIENMEGYTQVHVLATTQIFLESSTIST